MENPIIPSSTPFAENNSPTAASQYALQTTRVVFDFKLEPREMIVFRAAIANKVGFDHDLFHNHATNHSASEQKLHYRYPLIQYQLDKRRAAILGINEGAEELSRFLTDFDEQIFFKRSFQKIRIQELQNATVLLQALPDPKTYRLQNWIALNSDNLKTWSNTASYAERIIFLEKKLNNHLVAFYNKWDWQRPEIKATILSMPILKHMVYKRMKCLVFDLVFKANIELPNHIGIGKAVSEGFGRCEAL